MSVHLKERGRGSQPDSTENHLDHRAQGEDIVRSSCEQLPPHGSSWFPGLECQDHSQASGQTTGSSHSAHSSKCDVLEAAGGSFGMTNEEQGAERAEQAEEEEEEQFGGKFWASRS